MLEFLLLLLLLVLNERCDLVQRGAEPRIQDQDAHRVRTARRRWYSCWLSNTTPLRGSGWEVCQRTTHTHGNRALSSDILISTTSKQERGPPAPSRPEAGPTSLPSRRACASDQQYKGCFWETKVFVSYFHLFDFSDRVFTADLNSMLPHLTLCSFVAPGQVPRGSPRLNLTLRGQRDAVFLRERADSSTTGSETGVYPVKIMHRTFHLLPHTPRVFQQAGEFCNQVQNKAFLIIIIKAVVSWLQNAIQEPRPRRPLFSRLQIKLHPFRSQHVDQAFPAAGPQVSLMGLYILSHFKAPAFHFK